MINMNNINILKTPLHFVYDQLRFNSTILRTLSQALLNRHSAVLISLKEMLKMQMVKSLRCTRMCQNCGGSSLPV